MNPRHIAVTALLAAVALATAVPAARAASMPELRKRFAARLPALNKLKAAGKIGETDKGYVEARVALGDKKLTKLLADENADRTALYQIIARQTGTTVQAVAKRNGLRNWQKARRGEWYKKKGKWIQKK
jgi:uncharacterized protein YdbL (DUF1318 family)